MPINYAEQYLQALQQRFAVGLRFNALYNTPMNQQIRWVNAKTVQIPRIDVTGMVDVDRDNVGSYTRQVDNDWETKTLQHDREFSTLVDPQDVDETNMAVTIANITQVFNDEQKIPEMDKYMSSKLYSEYLDYGKWPEKKAVTASNALETFDDLMKEMDDNEVPEEGRILYCTPESYKALKNAEDLKRYIRVDQNTNQVSRAVRSLDEVQIVRVPPARMKTLYDFTRGAEADNDAVQIHMILIHPMSIVAPMKYEFVNLQEPSAVSKGKYLYYERSYWDVFALERKVHGIEFVIADVNITVTETSPEDGDTDVAVDTTITVTFSDNIEPSDAYDDISLEDSGGDAVAFSKSISDNVLTIEPDSNLSASEEHTVTIPRKAVAKEDQPTVRLESEYSFSFTTAS